MSGAAYGFFGRYLEIDLTAGAVRVRPLESALVADYIGGRGLATRLFCDEADPAGDPLGPENVIVIAVSPLVGTNAPTSARGHMVFKSPLTGLIGTSNSGGGWGFSFKAAGYDALVIKGRSPEPVWVDITPAEVKILPAGNLWGRDIHETTAELTAGFAAADRPRVLCIGPAGENLVRFADVANDKNRVYGRGGPGAVWGSKNLKAVRVAGREKIADPRSGEVQVGIRSSLVLDPPGPGDQAHPPGAGHGGTRRAHQRHRHAAAPKFPGLHPPGGGPGAHLRRDHRPDHPRAGGRLLSLPDRLPAAYPDYPGRLARRNAARGPSTRPSS